MTELEQNIEAYFGIIELVDNRNGTTLFRHTEKFNGILVSLMAKQLDTKTKSGFEAMNKKLKEIAER